MVSDLVLHSQDQGFESDYLRQSLPLLLVTSSTLEAFCDATMDVASMPDSDIFDVSKEPFKHLKSVRI